MGMLITNEAGFTNMFLILYYCRPAPNSEIKYCKVEFNEAEHANTCLTLTNTMLINKPIHISLHNTIPKSVEKASPASPPASSILPNRIRLIRI